MDCLCYHTAIQGHSNCVILLYCHFKDGRPTVNMVKCQSMQYNSVSCEGCHTDRNLLPVVGCVQSMCSVMKTVKYMGQ